MTSVGTLPSGLSARYPGEPMSLFLKDIGRPSKATPISCSAMCTAIELEPGAKYRVSMLQAYLALYSVFPSLRAKRSNPVVGKADMDCNDGGAYERLIRQPDIIF